MIADWILALALLFFIYAFVEKASAIEHRLSALESKEPKT